MKYKIHLLLLGIPYSGDRVVEKQEYGYGDIVIFLKFDTLHGRRHQNAATQGVKRGGGYGNAFVSTMTPKPREWNVKGHKITCPRVHQKY